MCKKMINKYVLKTYKSMQINLEIKKNHLKQNSLMFE